MYEQEECMYPLAEVRAHKADEQCGKLLFTLVENQYGISILLKRKGESEMYCIPLFNLLEPFVSDLEELRRCTRLQLCYAKGIKRCDEMGSEESSNNVR